MGLHGEAFGCEDMKTKVYRCPNNMLCYHSIKVKLALNFPHLQLRVVFSLVISSTGFKQFHRTISHLACLRFASVLFDEKSQMSPNISRFFYENEINNTKLDNYASSYFHHAH